MKNFEPIPKPYGYLTLKQWAEKYNKFPINIDLGTLCYWPDKDGNPPMKNGRIMAYAFYGPEDVRALTAEDEIYLMDKYKTYKPRFKCELDLSLDKNLGSPIRSVIDKHPKIVDEYDKKVADALKNTPFTKIDVGNLVAYDTETTGLYPENNDELLQITILAEDGRILLDTYVKPYKNKEWPEAMAVNHITPEMVKDCPYPHEIAPKVRDIFLSAKEILGYNVNFDNRVVTKCLGIDMSGLTEVDPLKGFRGVKTPTKHHKLIDAVDYYCPEIKEEFESNAHDSSADIKATLDVYYAFEKKKEEIIDEILSNLKEELLKCKSEKSLERVVKEFKKQNPQSLKDKNIKDRANQIYLEACEIILKDSKNNKKEQESPKIKEKEEHIEEDMPIIE